MNNVEKALLNTAWLITEDSLNTMVAVAQRTRSDQLEPTTPTVGRKSGKVGVINIIGPIFRYANLFTEVSGATSTAKIMKQFKTFLADKSVSQIVLNIDSPGGQATGINELADMIYNARGKKKVTAYVGGSGCSAAYWIASAAEEIVIDDTSVLGSIGVVLTLQKKRDDTIEIVNSASPKKRIDPEDPEAQKQVVNWLDDLANVFIERVAKFRGVDRDKVTSKFGEGGVLIGENTISVGMADRIGSFDHLIMELGGKNMELSYLKENHPDLYQQIMQEGAASREEEITALAEERDNLQTERDKLQETAEVHKKSAAELQREGVLRDLTDKVGKEHADQLIQLHTKVEDDLIMEIANSIHTLQSAVDDIGGSQGEHVEDTEILADEALRDKVHAYAKEHDIPVYKAWTRYAAEHPEQMK